MQEVAYHSEKEKVQKDVGKDQKENERKGQDYKL